jgi:hypothetical protein
MKTKKASLIIAAVMATNSMAFAITATDTLKQGTATSGLRDLTMNAALLDIVADATDIKTSELIATRDQLFSIINTMNAIKNDNESDQFLKYANSIQAGLALATTATLGAHITSAEKRRFMLTISAATALVSSATRLYKERSSLDRKDVSEVLSSFNAQLMANKRALTPEMRELVNEVSKMSNQVLNSQSVIEKLVGNASDASYITTIVIVGMAVAHWVSPKLAKEADATLKTISVKMGEVVKGAGKFADESKKVTAGTASGSVLPDVIGNVMGLNTENSQRLIAETVNNLTAATVNFQAQIDLIRSAGK